MELKPENTQTVATHDQQKQENVSVEGKMDDSQSSGEFDSEALYDESLFSINTVVTRIDSRPFNGIPKEWHETIQVKHKVTQRVKQYFRCMHSGCK